MALPDASIGAYSSDSYDDAGEICGVRKAVVVELKKGGFQVKQKEVDQARDYCREIRKAGKVQPQTQIVAYVLGATLDEGLEPLSVGNPPTTTVIPMVYDTILQRAHRRTFDLHRRLKESMVGGKAADEIEGLVGNGQPTLL